MAGHSFGGIIAYEMALQLANEGVKVDKLIMLDTDVDVAFLYASNLRKKVALMDHTARKIVFIIKEMSKSWSNASFFYNRKKEEVLERYYYHYFSNKHSKVNEHQIQKLELQNSEMISNYQILPRDVKIDLIRADGKKDYVREPEFMGWKSLALKGVHVHDVPGDHLGILQPPYDRITAKILQSILDR